MNADDWSRRDVADAVEDYKRKGRLKSLTELKEHIEWLTGSPISLSAVSRRVSGSSGLPRRRGRPSKIAGVISPEPTHQFGIENAPQFEQQRQDIESDSVKLVEYSTTRITCRQCGVDSYTCACRPAISIVYGPESNQRPCRHIRILQQHSAGLEPVAISTADEDALQTDQVTPNGPDRRPNPHTTEKLQDIKIKFQELVNFAENYPSSTLTMESLDVVEYALDGVLQSLQENRKEIEHVEASSAYGTEYSSVQIRSVKPDS